MEQIKLHKSFLSLVRLGLGKTTEVITQPIDWKETENFANRHGLLAVLVDGIEKLPSVSRAPQELLLEWIGEVLQDYEYRYEQYKHAIAEMARFYNSHGLKMMVLKGFACSLDWPKPEHRPCGDIDIWMFGKQKEADKALLKANTDGTNYKDKFTIDTSHHHHTVFYWGEFMVENHYDFINVHARKANAKLEKIYKELGQDDSHFVEVEGERVYMPSPNLHALFLIRHLVSHFVGAYISLRQVLDWAFFVEKHGKDVDWDWLDGVLEEFGMKEFYCIVNAICIEDLGFDASLFHGVQFNPQTKERVFNDILCPAFDASAPTHLMPRIIYKYRRWQGNGWKHALCYKENHWVGFWTLLKSHLIKPEI